MLKCAKILVYVGHNEQCSGWFERCTGNSLQSDTSDFLL